MNVARPSFEQRGFCEMHDEPQPHASNTSRTLSIDAQRKRMSLPMRYHPRPPSRLQTDPTQRCDTRAWLILHPERQCRAKSKQAGRQCRRIATPGHGVCRMHGSRSRGPNVVRWDCRPSAIEAKAGRARARISEPPPAHDGEGAHVLAATDVAELMALRGRTP